MSPLIRHVYAERCWPSADLKPLVYTCRHILYPPGWVKNGCEYQIQLLAFFSAYPSNLTIQGRNGNALVVTSHGRVSGITEPAKCWAKVGRSCSWLTQVVSFTTASMDSSRCLSFWVSRCCSMSFASRTALHPIWWYLHLTGLLWHSPKCDRSRLRGTSVEHPVGQGTGWSVQMV